MSNPKFTRKANQTLVLMRISSGNWAARDAHLTIGKGGGSHSDYTGRAQVHFPEPDWPANGRHIRSLLTVHESGTSAHGDFRGSSSRAAVYRIAAKPGYSVPDTADGYYTQQGSGDKYPGSTVAGTGREFSVNGAETHDVSDMVDAMLPSRIKRKSNGQPGGNALWGHFQIRSSDEDSASRSFILTDETTLVVEIKVAVTPDAPLITEIIGAQEGPGGPTIVGSTDGGTLEVVFAFRGAAGDTCSKAELAFMGVGATDDTPGTTVRTTGSITPSAGGGAGVYRIRLTGLTQGAEGRFRVRTTSQKGEQGDWSSLDDDDSHVRLAVIPGPPLDIVFQPFTDDPHILFSLNSTDPADYLTGGEAEVTLLPQGTLAWASGMVDIGGTTRRADLDTGRTFPDGQRVSYRVRTRNAQQVTGQWSAPREQTLRELTGPVVTPGPGRLASLTPTLTITDALFDGWRLRLLDATDDARVLYDSGGTTVINQTSVGPVVPGGVLTWGQSFRVVASTLPDGSGTYGAESQPQAYSIAALPVTVLSVPDAVSRRVGVEDVVWQRTVTDPDGAAIASIEQEIRVAATPQGSGALVVLHDDVTSTPLRTIPGGTVTYETAVDARARATNDAATGPWSPWVTISALQPPDVDLISPADGAVLADPTDTLDWSVTGYGGRAQASAVLTLYDASGAVLGAMPATTETGSDIPAYLLDDATAYSWDVTVTDTQGMVTTSASRSFTTAFAEPLPINVLVAGADPDSGTVVLSWDEGAEPYPHNIEVTWIADDGSPVRIDGGPESLLDGNVPFTGASLTHIGARLGENVYYVAVSNGWRSAEPVSASATLASPDWRSGAIVDAAGDRTGLVVTSVPKQHSGTIESHHPPGGQRRQVTWGSNARSLSMGIHLVPSEDGELVSLFRGLMGSGTPVWVKAAAPYMDDPLWATLQSFTSVPMAGGAQTIDLDWLELGDPVHAILPPAVEPEPVGEGNIYVDTEALDFGTLVET